MKRVSQLHEHAMEQMDLALIAREKGLQSEACRLFREAFESESQAAGLVEGDSSFEPTRSILHRSAATLAVDCGLLDEAARLIIAGLQGNPPADIAQELRGLSEQVASGREAEQAENGAFADSRPAERPAGSEPAPALRASSSEETSKREA